MLERGEKIDSLVQKSDGLSAQSKMFYTQVCGPTIYYRNLSNPIPTGQEAKLLLHSDVNSFFVTFELELNKSRFVLEQLYIHVINSQGRHFLQPSH